MIGVFIILILAIFVAVVIFETDHEGWGFPAAVAVIGLGVWLLFSVNFPHETYVNKSTELVSLGDNTTLEGNFFLGTGSIDDEMYYFYYQKDGDGYSFGKTKAAKAVIYYSEDAPRIDDISCERLSRWSWVFDPVGCDLLYDMRDRIYVPEGTIKENYILDLQ